MKIELATEGYSEKIVDFFNENLEKQNEAIYSEEFFCPFGVKAAIKRKQVIVVLDNEKVLAAVRFYPRKRDEIVSVYQFAVDREHRGKGFLQKMLQKIEFDKFEFICPKDIEFNNFYKKLGTEIHKKGKGCNYWMLTT